METLFLLLFERGRNASRSGRAVRRRARGARVSSNSSSITSAETIPNVPSGRTSAGSAGRRFDNCGNRPERAGTSARPNRGMKRHDKGRGLGGMFKLERSRRLNGIIVILKGLTGTLNNISSGKPSYHGGGRGGDKETYLLGYHRKGQRPNRKQCNSRGLGRKV